MDSFYISGVALATVREQHVGTRGSPLRDSSFYILIISYCSVYWLSVRIYLYTAIEIWNCVALSQKNQRLVVPPSMKNVYYYG